MLRVLIILATLVAIERAASACCLGCACTQYKQRDVEVVQERAPGYIRSSAGHVPAWSIARITKFLALGTWKPSPLSQPVGSAPPAPPDRPSTVVQPAPAIRFITPNQVAKTFKDGALSVLIRRIEKTGSAILVEVNHQTFKLAPCPRKRGYTCLVNPGALTLQPIPPPGDPVPPSNDFAKPPP